MLRLIIATPLLIAGEIPGKVGDHLFNLGAIVAGSSLRRNP